MRNECAAEPRCCKTNAERARCAADLARRRAERAHLIVTNHAFVLSDTAFFANVVFDECDHLHPQTHSIVSFEMPRLELASLITRLSGKGGRGGTLTRLQTLFSMDQASLFDDPISRAITQAIQGCDTLDQALHDMGLSVFQFLRFRAAREQERKGAQASTLLREFMTLEPGDALRRSHGDLYACLAQLNVSLAKLEGELAVASERRIQRLRSRLVREISRIEEFVDTLGRWLPTHENELRFDPAFFYDVETGYDADDWNLVLRIILPQVYLGTHFLPRLESGALLSASTYLRTRLRQDACVLGPRSPDEGTNAGSQRVDESAPQRFKTPCRTSTFETTTSPRASCANTAPTPCSTTAARSSSSPRTRPSIVRKDTPRTSSWTSSSSTSPTSRNATRAASWSCSPTPKTSRPAANACTPSSVRAASRVITRTCRATRKRNSRTSSVRSKAGVLLGVDTFWYGVDFPGEDLEHVVMVKLPYGALSRFMEAQCAVMGRNDQYSKIYLTEALAMFRQGFGRLLRTERDRGTVHILDRRVLDKRHQVFLRELPGLDGDTENRPEVYRGPARECLRRALEMTSTPHPEPANDSCIRRRT